MTRSQQMVIAIDGWVYRLDFARGGARVRGGVFRRPMSLAALADLLLTLDHATEELRRRQAIDDGPRGAGGGR